MSRYARLEVEDEYGIVVVFIEKPPTPVERAALAGVLADLGVDAQLAEKMLPLLIRRLADDAAYERVCERQGLLL